VTVDRRVLFLGDSFVAGAGDPAALGWPGRVCAAAWSAGVPVTPYNLGVRRETSGQVAARWRTEAAPRLVADADCRVTVSFGANDMVFEDDGPMVAPARSAEVLAALLSSLDVPAFVVGPAPVGDPGADRRIVALTASYAQVAAAAGVPFVPVAEALMATPAWTSEAQAGDGAHPGAGGYDALAGLVLAGGWLDWLRK
jgi:lysophospholipase L1-like esterase